MRTFLVLALLMCSLTARADQFIAVHASGWVEATPDMLSLTVAARATGKDVTALQDQVNRTIQQAADAAREAGVAEDDIDTSRITVRPEYQWQGGIRRSLGQTVRRELSMVLRNTDNYGALVQALGRFKVEEVQAPVAGHSNLEELKLQALDAALANGFSKASRIAAGIDAKLGPVLQVEEQGASRAVPVARMMAAEASDSAPVVEFAQQRISASVTMRFAIE